MYPVENPNSPFLPYDLCWIKGTKEIVLVTEVNLNPCQTVDKHQWSYSVTPITPGNTKCAWFSIDELEFIKNVFDIIAEKSAHPFGSKHFKYKSGESSRRSND